jgi:hypothetical protein
VCNHGTGWAARIKCDRKQYYLETHSTREEAAFAYDKRALELFGPEAFLNLTAKQYAKLAGRVVTAYA